MKPLTEEQIGDNERAVGALLRGEPIECSSRHEEAALWCRANATLKFYFDLYLYRPAPWQLPRHIPGFRALLDSEEWHRQDWTREMLPEGWRPCLTSEMDGMRHSDVEWCGDGHTLFQSITFSPFLEGHGFFRTRRPLPAIAPAMRAWSKPEDVPGPVCWLRFPCGPISFHECLIQEVNDSGVFINRGDGIINRWDYLSRFQYSTTRAAGSWQPCQCPDQP